MPTAIPMHSMHRKVLTHLGRILRLAQRYRDSSSPAQPRYGVPGTGAVTPFRSVCSPSGVAAERAGPRRSGEVAGHPPSMGRSACTAVRLAAARESWQARCQTPSCPGTRRSGAASRTVTPRPGVGCGRRVPKSGCRLIGRCRGVGMSAAEQGPAASPGAAAWGVAGRVARRRPRVRPAPIGSPRACAGGGPVPRLAGARPGRPRGRRPTTIA